MRDAFAKMKIGITGQSGFIGKRLSQVLSGSAGIVLTPFEKAFFDNEGLLEGFLSECDLVIHLAFLNRHANQSFLYDTNLELARKLAVAWEKSTNPPALLYASSIREGEATAYGQAKRICREILESAARKKSGRMESLRIPNVFGPGAIPYNNSFIATFSDQLLTGQTPVITENREVPLLYIDSLCRYLSVLIGQMEGGHGISITEVPSDFRMPVPKVLEVLKGFAREYRKQGTISEQKDPNLENLRRTFLSYTK